MDSFTKTALIGIVGLTLLVILFMGPAMWSSSTDWPLVERPWRWLMGKLRNRSSRKEP